MNKQTTDEKLKELVNEVRTNRYLLFLILGFMSAVFFGFVFT